MAENQHIFTTPHRGLEFFHFTALTRPFPPHFHANFLIGCLASGSRLIRLRSAQTIVSPGDLVIIPPYATHACEALNGLPSEWFCVHVQTDQLAPAPLIIHDQKELCVTFLNLAANAFSTKSLSSWPAFLQRLRSFCASYAKSIIAHEQPEKPQSPSISVAGDFCLKDLAAAKNMSKFQFLRQFHAQKGITPHKYITNLRIIHAQHLLYAGSPLSACAAACGFCDQSHFARAFKASIGLTPGAYRSSILLAKKAA